MANKSDPAQSMPRPIIPTWGLKTRIEETSVSSVKRAARGSSFWILPPVIHRLIDKIFDDQESFQVTNN
jgi:hypothetical protein